jgi:hypothetical protein
MELISCRQRGDANLHNLTRKMFSLPGRARLGRIQVTLADRPAFRSPAYASSSIREMARDAGNLEQRSRKFESSAENLPDLRISITTCETEKMRRIECVCRGMHFI